MGDQQDKSNQQLLKRVSTVGIWTLLSRVLGFVRDVLIARVLGAGMLADAFFVAFKLPNFFRRIFAEGSFTVALVPVLAEQKEKGEEEVHQYLNAMAGLLLLSLLVFTVLGMLLMPWLLLAFAPGFADEPNRWQQTLTLARWMFPYLALISLTAMAWAVLNAYRKFAVPAATPVLLNVGMIIGAVCFAPMMESPALALAWGVLLGGVMQLAVQFPALKAIGWVPRPRLNFRLPAIARTMRLFFPAVLGTSAVQINILIGTALATLLPVGAVSYLYYADRIVQLPLGLFGIAMGTALLPALSSHFAAGQKEKALSDLRHGLVWLSWICIPAMVGIFLLAEPVVMTLFEHGAFSHRDTIATTQTLLMYAVGLLCFCWVKILATACYAQHEAKAPTRFAVISVGANIGFALILLESMQHLGLALATSLSSLINVLLLIHFLQNRHGKLFGVQALQRMLKAVLAVVPMIVYLLLVEMLWSFPLQGVLYQGLWLGLMVGGGCGLYACIAHWMGEPLFRFKRA
ncbi:MAG: murein biosynthesis integral membrane protein MurJ [Mariprofundaceae bacterium]|nr:murein biosynthesis integral membrane protein MurJ [Mariprofundaceae bacterium]